MDERTNAAQHHHAWVVFDHAHRAGSPAARSTPDFGVPSALKQRFPYRRLLPFDASAPGRRRDLLAAIAVFAVGGTELLHEKRGELPAVALAAWAPEGARLKRRGYELFPHASV
jgi:hypothetical protein